MYEIRTRATTLTGSRANCYTNTPLRLTSFTLRLLYASYMDSHPSILDLTQVKEGYRKYEETPDGKRILIGSTQKLTKHGFSLYMEQIYAYGADLGVRFSETDQAKEM